MSKKDKLQDEVVNKKEILITEYMTPEQIQLYAMQIETLQQQEHKLNDERQQVLYNHFNRLNELIDQVKDLESKKEELNNILQQIEERKIELNDYNSKIPEAKKELQETLLTNESIKTELENKKIELESRESSIAPKEMELQSMREELTRLIEENKKGEEARIGAIELAKILKTFKL